MAIDPKSPYDTIAIRDVNDPSKIVRMEVIKVEPNSYKHGTWTYYNTVTGGIDRTEDWVMNRPRVEVEQEEDDLAPIDVSDGKTGGFMISNLVQITGSLVLLLVTVFTNAQVIPPSVLLYNPLLAPPGSKCQAWRVRYHIAA